MVLILLLRTDLLKNLLFIIFIILGVTAMGCNAKATDLKWEWPADRDVTIKIIVEILKVEKSKKFIKSPSLASNLPDPVEISAMLKTANSPITTELVTLTLPEVDLGDASAGTTIGMAMIDAETVVCVAIVPNNLDLNGQNEWLAQWQCH
ncbi:MAG: hypothetical protein GY799_24235 [Desulfobulbaceae bacterium]|nr:hypothetical protein [Desulfobulbaceae bacterium]